MGLLKKCAEVYSHYVGYNYTFLLDCGISVKAAFKPQHFHHLVGLQYLKDIPQVNTKLINNLPSDIYRRILRDRITQALIENSNYYSKIKNRLEHFPDLGAVISSKIIVDFDYTKVKKTEILSRYLLYKEYENGYSILGLKYDSRHDEYVPETFMFEPSDYYIKDQITYDIVDVVIENCSKRKR